MKADEIEKEPRFIADCHFGKLAKYLRLMGFDTLFFPQIDDNDLIDLANSEGRIILTRDKGLFERQKADCYLVAAVKIEKQLHEIVRAFDLQKHQHPFSLCIVCNHPLHIIEKEAILHRLPPKVIRYFSRFEICDKCNRIYWQGDHYNKMKASLEKMLQGV